MQNDLQSSVLTIFEVAKTTEIRKSRKFKEFAKQEGGVD
jgi:hypothetical protein